MTRETHNVPGNPHCETHIVGFPGHEGKEPLRVVLPGLFCLGKQPFLHFLRLIACLAPIAFSLRTVWGSELIKGFRLQTRYPSVVNSVFKAVEYNHFSSFSSHTDEVPFTQTRSDKEPCLERKEGNLV